MLQINVTHLRLLLLACLVETAKADGWDDFANNLATDLAPLLALFGEQVTKQFLCESTTMWDNFIFAMAPLGVLTAVVSAIRVCGGPSLRAFIGRAQEGGAIAEAELCSSTSRDVCELYHNGAIVRVFGRPKILEIVHDREAAAFPDDSNSQSPPECGIYSFREYVKSPWAKKAGWEEHGKHAQDDTEAQKDPQKKKKKASNDNDDDDADQFAPNPNLSFNISIRKHPIFTPLAVVVGCLAQASVLVFGFLVTYTWRWAKDGDLPPTWAFPLMSLGTVLLCGGMFSCAFLVEQSTKERVFRRASDNSQPAPTIYVVQPGNQTVGDQTFDSFSFADSSDPLNEYTTSWKIPQRSVGKQTVSDEYTTLWTIFQRSVAGLGVWLAIIMTMCGFVLQFVGLRAMHSAVSVLQLGTILLMSIIRAGLRTRRLRKEQNLLHDRPDEVEGHELDWLALQMGQESPDAGDQGRKFWSVVGPAAELHSSSDHHEDGEKGNGDVSNDGGNIVTTSIEKVAAEAMSAVSQPKPPSAVRIFYYRSRLAELTGQATRVKSKSSGTWDEPLVHVRQQARQLKKAIESSAEILFAHAKVKPSWKDAESLPWTIDVAEYNYPESHPGNSRFSGKEASRVHLSLHKPLLRNSSQSMVWEVNQQNLEAVLGLWAWSIVSDPRTEKVDKFGLKVSTAPEVPTSRIIAVGGASEDIEREKTDIKFWIEDFPPLTSKKKWTAIPDRMERGPDTLWEMQDDETIRRVAAMPSSPGSRSNHPRLRLFGWQTAELPVSHGSSADVFALTTVVSHSIPAMCAQEMYQSFLCAIMAGLDSIGGQTKPLRGSRGFYFVNEVVSSLAECFKESGLGSTLDAYSIIIPALRCRSKLPPAEDALPVVHSYAEKLRKGENFQEAEAILKWAWQTALVTKDEQGLDASMLELGELYRYAYFSEDRSLKTFVAEGISWLKKQPHNDSVMVISGRYVDLLQRMVDHSQRNRPPTAHDIINAISENKRTDSLWLISQIQDVLSPDHDGRTVLSWAAQRGWPEMVKTALEIGSVVDSEDKLKRTPLSYAAEHGHADVVRILMERQALPMTEDSSRRTPLSYAAAGGDVRVVEILMDDPRVTTYTKDKNGQSPLHWAAKNGQVGAIKRLLQKSIMDDPDEKGLTPLIVALLSRQNRAAETLVERGANFSINIEQLEAWRWAIKNGEWQCAAFLLRLSNQESTGNTSGVAGRKAVLFLSPRSSRNSTGKAGLVAQEARLEAEVSAYVFGENGTQGEITMETVRYAAAGQYNVVARLCEQENGRPTMKDLKFDDDREFKIIDLLLDHLGKEVKVTDDVVMAAAGNVRSGKEVMMLLLSGQAKIQLTEESVETIAGIFDQDIMGLLLRKGGLEVKVTGDVVKAAAGNEWSGEGVMKLLLGERGLEVKVTDDVVKAAAGNRGSGEGVMKLLLGERGEEVKVTDDVVKAAAGNRGSGEEVMMLLLSGQAKIQLTEESVETIAGIFDQDIMGLLLHKGGLEVKVTGDVVKAAAENVRYGKEVMKLLLGERGKEVKVTDDVVKIEDTEKLVNSDFEILQPPQMAKYD